MSDTITSAAIPIDTMSINNNNNNKSSNTKSLELFEENENEKPPLSKFLNQIINFHSIMPSSKEMNDKLENNNIKNNEVSNNFLLLKQSSNTIVSTLFEK